MRKIPFIFLGLLAACSSGGTFDGNSPFNRIGTAIGNAANGEQRGQVEVFVKTNHPALIADIRAGGGPTLTQAFDIIEVPTNIRAGNTIRLQSELALYSANLDALIAALMVMSG